MNNNLIDALRTEDTLTYNGAVTNSTSLSSVLDLFFLSGACRDESVKNIERVLLKSYLEDKLLTLKCIFWAGDIRFGAGERRFFKIALNWLNNNYKQDFNNNLENVPEFSRWDVLFEIENEKVVSYIGDKLLKAQNGTKDSTIGLLAKWLPRKKQYNNFASKVRKYTKLSPKSYRKLLVKLSKTVEQDMCAKKWQDIKFEQVPSVAMNKYREAFNRNCLESFSKYLQKVREGKSKINSGAIFPHDIIKNCIDYYGSKELTKSQILQWENLPNYLEGTTNKMIPVCDVSGSMIGLPLAISVALGLYISERNTGCFKDAFITFSGRPQLQYLKGNINQRLTQLVKADWGMNTDLLAVFKLILDKAKANNISQDLMPEKVLIISDMEFDTCMRNTNYQAIKKEYKLSGYKLPQVVFWNVKGRAGNVPVTAKDENTSLISGANPSIIKNVLSGEISPISTMLKTLNNPRYDVIK